MNNIETELQQGRRSWGMARCVLQALTCVTLLGASSAALAEVKFQPLVGAEYIYYSNVFTLPSDGSVVNGADGGSGRSDRALTYFAGLNADYLFSRQKLTASGQYRHVNYDLFTQLDHNEYWGDLTLAWRLGHLLDGKLGYRYERSLLSYAELDTTQLGNTDSHSRSYLETSKTTTVMANLQMTPVWRLQTGAILRALDSPRPGPTAGSLPIPLVLDENTLQAAVRYVGLAHLSFGIDSSFVDGKYKNTTGSVNPQNADYTQSSYQFAGDYAVGGSSTFNGGIGYTKRRQQQLGDVSAVTGKLGYTRKISTKTSISLLLSRAVNSYVTTVSSEIDTIATVGFTWQATGKTTFELNYGWTKSDFPDEFVANSNGVTRLDHAQYVASEIKYQVLRWLRLKPYVRYDTRESNIGILQYHGHTVGIELRGLWE